MIVLAPAEVGESPDDAILASAQSSHTTIDVISGAPNPSLHDLSRKTGGHFHLVTSADAIENRIAQTYLSLLARYEIRYPSQSADAGTLRLRIQTPSGWGETTIPLPA